jgi:CRP-like cAMP-binding protein
MSPRNRTKFRNHILAALDAGDLALLEPHLQPVPLEKGKTLETANKKIENIYFPDRGMASVVGGATKPNRDVEVGIIGWEGMTGLPVIFGNHRSPHQTFIQLAGDGQRLAVSILRNVLTQSATLQSLLLKYAQAFLIQTTHTAIANARGTLEERLARWIVMAQDRTEGDRLALTHEFLSLMLAVRRPGVTEALHALENRGLITHDRGVITVVDREGLIAGANGLYGIPEAEYKRLLG